MYTDRRVFWHNFISLHQSHVSGWSEYHIENGNKKIKRVKVTSTPTYCHVASFWASWKEVSKKRKMCRYKLGSLSTRYRAFTGSIGNIGSTTVDTNCPHLVASGLIIPDP